MRFSTVFSSFVLGIVLATGGVMLAPSFAGEVRPAVSAGRQWLSISQIHEKLEAAGYRNVEKIEREHGGYEARATDRNGERIKLYLNPQTGEILDQRDHGKGERSDGEGRRREAASSADCNKRRCRDDIPQSKTSVTPVAR
jgi:hypothetical protein